MLSLTTSISVAGFNQPQLGFAEAVTQDLSEKYKDVGWYDECGGPYSYPSGEGASADELVKAMDLADQRIGELPALINSTTDEDQKQSLQEELECLSYLRNPQESNPDSNISEIFDGFSDAYKMVDLYNQRQDIDRQLFDLMNN